MVKTAGPQLVPFSSYSKKYSYPLLLKNAINPLPPDVAIWQHFAVGGYGNFEIAGGKMLM